MSITISDHAAKAIRGIIDRERAANNIQGEPGLRVGVKGGGCSGFSHQLYLDVDAQPGDHVLESQGIKIFVDPKSYIYVSGSEVDYKEDPFQGGFFLNNPQAKHTCGCGSSFSV